MRDRGGRTPWAGKAQAVMVELYYGGNAGFYHVIDPRKVDLAEAINDLAKAFVVKRAER